VWRTCPRSLRPTPCASPSPRMEGPTPPASPSPSAIPARLLQGRKVVVWRSPSPRAILARAFLPTTAAMEGRLYHSLPRQPFLPQQPAPASSAHPASRHSDVTLPSPVARHLRAPTKPEGENRDPLPAPRSARPASHHNDVAQVGEGRSRESPPGNLPGITVPAAGIPASTAASSLPSPCSAPPCPRPRAPFPPP
jgi:hypothetical protein